MLIIWKIFLSILTIICGALFINNVTLHFTNKANKYLTTIGTIALMLIILAGIFVWGINYIPFGQ